MTSRHLLTPLFVGLALGLMLAGGPSCGSAAPSPSSCGPDNCEGCCASGKCVLSPTNAKVSSCGRNGAACDNCGTRTCVDFACSGGGDGGTQSGVCGPHNCVGCCSGTSTSSVCITSGSTTNCGGAGSLCTSCGAGQACTAGSCKIADGGAGQVGTPCTTDGECAALGPAHTCKKKTSSGGTAYQDGYCTRTCADDRDCPVKALCLGPQPGYGENDSVCWARCARAEECRVGYDCHAVGGGESACWISPLPPFDAGPPSDKVGRACATDATCSNPPDDGVCLTDTLLDGGVSAFTGGYCSAPCDDSNHCSADGTALCISLGTFGACAASCSTPLQGQGDCRVGYVCRSIRSSLDGGPLPIGFCWPSCKTAGCASGTCLATGYCG
jgi:hypothetical protein